MKKNRLIIFFLTGMALLAGCEKKEPASASFSGYIEAEYIYVSSPMAGRMEKLFVQPGQTIQGNEPLFSLESENEAATLQRAQESLQTDVAILADLQNKKRPVEIGLTQTQLKQAEIAAQHTSAQLARDEAQFLIGAISETQVEATRTANRQDQARIDELRKVLRSNQLPLREDQIRLQEAQVRAAESGLKQAESMIAQKSVRAPKTALVFDTLFKQGEWITAGTPVISLLPPENIKVRFFVPQQEINKLRIGRSIMMSCDGCASAYTAKITYIAPHAEPAPPTIKETHSKFLFMVDAKADDEGINSLRPGQLMEVRIIE